MASLVMFGILLLFCWVLHREDERQSRTIARLEREIAAMREDISGRQCEGCGGRTTGRMRLSGDEILLCDACFEALEESNA